MQLAADMLKELRVPEEVDVVVVFDSAFGALPVGMCEAF
jgi:hypothetical protein